MMDIAPVKSVSLIVATYNQDDILRQALLSAFEQTRLPDQIVIADDGSREETAELIRNLAEQSPVPILHAWQPNEGFRAARSRNNAITVATGDYLVFLDGDCFLNKYFIADHLSLVKENQYIVGSRVNIRKTRQEYILRTGDRRISFFSSGTSKKLNAIRSPLWARFYHKTGSMASANFSVWRNDLLRLNGFDNNFHGHGGEDVELAARLQNGGIQFRRMVHLGIAYHFSHPRRSVDYSDEVKKVIADTVAESKVACENGLAQIRAPREEINGKSRRFYFDSSPSPVE